MWDSSNEHLIKEANLTISTDKRGLNILRKFISTRNN